LTYWIITIILSYADLTLKGHAVLLP
jgi:hypothetical protein